jgi:hypothetical protein
MVLTTVVLLAVVIIACVVGVAVIPRFDRASLTPLPARLAKEPRASRSRSA